MENSAHVYYTVALFSSFVMVTQLAYSYLGGGEVLHTCT